MSLFFSPPVRTYSVILQHHQAPTIIDKFIATGFVQFQMNPYDDSTDPFYIIYSRVKQLKFKLTALNQQITQKYGQEVPELSTEEKELTIGRMKDYIEENQIDYLRYLDMEEAVVNQKLQKFRSMTTNYDNVIGDLCRLEEQCDLVKLKQEVAKQAESGQFVLLTGTCPRKVRYIIERLIFRKTHGHSYLTFQDRYGQLERDMFICFISKGIYKNISTKLNNLFSINGATIYDLPNQIEHLVSYQQTLNKKIKEYNHLLQISGQQFGKAIQEHVNQPQTSLQSHLVRITHLERIIYIICHSKPVGTPAKHHLFTIHVPQNEVMPTIPVSLIPMDDPSKPRTIMPRLPCLLQVNILTQMYSIPKYNEIIPSVFMFITVPFLFGMMFSDMGHGLMLLSICYFMGLGPIFFLMGFFSCYCGLIYNQFFGMKIILWDHLGVLRGQWGLAENGLNFQNSLKMKLSMVIAFVHMLFGTVLKMANEIKRGQMKHLYFDSLPKLVLMFTTVGYLVYLIITKWLIDFTGRQDLAPSVINTMLQLYLGYKDRKTSILGSMETQKYVGSVLNGISLFCILIMVFNHTFRHKFEMFLFKHKRGRSKEKVERYQKLQEDDFQIGEQINEELQRSKEVLQNNQVNRSVTYYYQKQQHQSQLGALEVFQYILSLISSTTSYLRLFALSLAHAKLSHLLLDFLLSSLSSQQPSISIIRCIVFFMTTVGMMLLLDVMECLMHVVRLHWVEWMGKFYVGTGVLFEPQVQQNFK